MSQQPEYLVGKFYTAARKFKQLIGQLPDGTTIPGGPYTLTQFVPALIIVVLFGLKAWIFGFGSMLSFLIQTGIIALIAISSVFLLGKLPPTRRSIFHLISTYPALVTSSRYGYWVGKPLEKTNYLNALVQLLPALGIIFLFILKILILGTGGTPAFFLQLVLVTILCGASIFIIRKMKTQETPTEESTAYEPTEQEIDSITTTKTHAKPMSGFGRFQSIIK